ncbi:MAG TPA: CBS domain-containing protein [Candidatus Limnocylindrales bacterium]|nr:CBS domain-containing protein [Candidatus Limnocylindrales bacterium]
MLVKDLMSKPVATCRRETNLGAAVQILWNQNCGFLPVVDAEEKVVGVITDRDICIALGTRNHPPGEIFVGDVISGNVISCKTDDEIHHVLPVMAEARVRRLPVLDFQGKLAGILSMDDAVLRAETGRFGKAPALSFDEVAAALKRLYRPALPEVVREKKAAAA